MMLFHIQSFIQLAVVSCLAAVLVLPSHAGAQVITVFTNATDPAARLRCFEGDFQPRPAWWTKDGDPFNGTTAPSRVTFTSVEVTIDPVLPSDEGLYRCNNGVSLEFTVPGRASELHPPIIMHDLGSTFTIPCDITLGPISLTKNYKVTWLRFVERSNSDFSSIGSCRHSDLSGLDSPVEDDTEDCAVEGHSISLQNFSLTVYNLSVSDLEINLTAPQVTYKCRVAQMSRPTFHSFAHTVELNTVVAFRYKPAQIIKPLQSHIVAQSGDNVTLEIEFQGHPLTLRGVEWAVNGHPLPSNLSSVTRGDTESSIATLFLSNIRAESAGSVTVTVNVHDNSSDTTNTTLIVIPPIEELSTSRPAQCNHTAPVLSFNIPAPIPVPRGTVVSAMPGTSLRLHIEYTRIDPSQADSVTRTPEMIGEEKDASVLFGSTHMEVAMDSLPYTVAAWRMYALRIRLEILGMVSIVWSPYSLPLCISCEDCLQPEKVEINLRLSVPDSSDACSDLDKEETADGLSSELVRVIQETCPDYLCRDLTLRGARFSCISTDSSTALFSATASGVGMKQRINAFLVHLSNRAEPLMLSVNGSISIQVDYMPPSVQPPSSSHGVIHIAGTTGGGSFVLVIATTCVVFCAVWRWKRVHRKGAAASSDGGGTHQQQNTVVTQPTPTQLTTPSEEGTGLPHASCWPLPSYRSPNTGVHPVYLLSPPSSEASSGRARYPAVIQLQQSVHRVPPPSALTMSEAGDLAQFGDNVDDASSMNFSNYAQSEFSFISDTSSRSRAHLAPLHLSTAPTQHQNPSIPHNYVHIGRNSAQPLLLDPAHTRTPSRCSCSCHSREHIPIPSPSPSMSILDSHRIKNNLHTRWNHAKLEASSACAVPPSQIQHRYWQWSDSLQPRRQQQQQQQQNRRNRSRSVSDLAHTRTAIDREVMV